MSPTQTMPYPASNHRHLIPAKTPESAIRRNPKPTPTTGETSSSQHLSPLHGYLDIDHRSRSFSPPTSSHRRFLHRHLTKRLAKRAKEEVLRVPFSPNRSLSQQSSIRLRLAHGSEIRDNDQEEVQKLLRSAARDCVPQDRNSFVSFQANTGVEVCTFQLVLNNASSLLADKDPTKLEAEAKLSDLIRSFSLLNGMANETGILFDSNREKVADALMDAIATLNKFEQGIKDCLEI